MVRKIRFIKLTEQLLKLFIKYEDQYGKQSLISYLEGYIRGLKS